MTNRYLEGARPAPRAAVPSRRWPRAGPTRWSVPASGSRRCLLHDALAELWEFVGGANKTVDAEQPWDLAKAAKAGDEAAATRLAGVLGRPPRGVPARRARGRAVHAGHRRRASSPSSATPSRTAPTATAARRSSTSSAWGAHAAEAGRVTAPEPLFPRLEVETDDRRARPGVSGRAASRRQPLPPQRRSVRGRRRSGPRRRHGWPASSGSSSRAGTSRRASARSTWPTGSPWLDVGVGVHPHDAAKVDDAGWARIVELAARRARRGHRRDRARLRPRLQPDPGPADEPAAQPRPRPATRASRRSSTAARRTAGATPRTRSSRSWPPPGWGTRAGRRRSGTGRRPIIHSYSGPLDYGRAVHRPRARHQLLGTRLPGAARRRRPTSRALVPADRVLVETDSPFLSPPGAPRSRNEPEWVRVTAAWLADRRGTTLEALGDDLVTAYDRTVPRRRRRLMDPRWQRAAPYAAVAAVAVIVILVAGRLLSRRRRPRARARRPRHPGLPRSRHPPRHPRARARRPRRRPARARRRPPTPTAAPTPTPAAGRLRRHARDRGSSRRTGSCRSRSPRARPPTSSRSSSTPASLGPAGPPPGELLAAEPPFTFALERAPARARRPARDPGPDEQHVALQRCRRAHLHGSSATSRSAYPALKQVVMYDESEGYAGWYIGYDGHGCVDLVRDGTDVVITIAH